MQMDPAQTNMPAGLRPLSIVHCGHWQGCENLQDCMKHVKAVGSKCAVRLIELRCRTTSSDEALELDA